MSARPPPPSLRRPLPDAARWRLFVAAPLPEIAAARAWEALAGVRILHPLVRWLPPNKLHLTLVFLGSTDAGRVDEIALAVATGAGTHSPFEVRTGDAGGRVGGRRGGVAWLRLADGGHETAQLSLDIDDAFGSHTFDARNAPRPHLTLARRATEAAVNDLRAVAGGIRLAWTVDRVVLYRSHTDPGGSRYEELASVMLSPRP